MSDAGALLDRLRAGGLLASGRRVVALVSGGRDSVCLLDAAAQLCGPEAVTALHVNYGLRDDADADERLCAELCARLGMELEVRRPRRPEGPGNLQGWARDARYGEAVALAVACGADVATGHTATDQVETVLYRLASSPGRRALLGMAPRSGRLVRPLLALTRDETAAWCRARGLPWREDASNATGVYARNRVRSDVVPALRSVHPAAEANVLRTAALLRDEAEVLDASVRELFGAGGSVALDRLRAAPPALARLALVALAETAAGGELVPAAAERLPDVLAAPDGAAVAVHGGVELVVERGAVHARRTTGVAAPPRAKQAGAEAALTALDARRASW